MNKILLIEDEKDAVDAIVSLLETRGYGVTPVHTGKEAIKRLQEDEFGMVIVDLVLPDMDGAGICTFIRHDRKIRKLPIIVSTALDDEFTELMVKKLGINEFLSKPYHMEALLEAVKRCLK